MAARLSGSGADGLVLYNAPDWHERVHLMKRDCIVDTPVLANAVQAAASKLEQYMPNCTMYSTDAHHRQRQSCVPMSWQAPR